MAKKKRQNKKKVSRSATPNVEQLDDSIDQTAQESEISGLIDNADADVDTQLDNEEVKDEQGKQENDDGTEVQEHEGVTDQTGLEVVDQIDDKTEVDEPTQIEETDDMESKSIITQDEGLGNEIIEPIEQSTVIESESEDRNVESTSIEESETVELSESQERLETVQQDEPVVQENQGNSVEESVIEQEQSVEVHIEEPVEEPVEEVKEVELEEAAVNVEAVEEAVSEDAVQEETVEPAEPEEPEEPAEPAEPVEDQDPITEKDNEITEFTSEQDQAKLPIDLDSKESDNYVEDIKESEPLEPEPEQQPEELESKENTEEPEDHTINIQEESPTTQSVTQLDPTQETESKASEATTGPAEELTTLQLAESQDKTEPTTPEPEQEPIIQPTESIESKIPDHLNLSSVSKGPYALSQLISHIDLHDESIPDSKDSRPTCIQTYENNLYIGTSIGEILRYEVNSDSLKLTSRSYFHQARRFPIRKILLLPNINKAVILAGSLASCFNLPDMTQANIGRIKDVNDISLDYNNTAKNDSSGVHCIVFAVKQIRIINVTTTSLRLVKDITYGGIVKGLRRSGFAAVANNEFYDLIDLDNFSKIPLFPISTGGEANSLEPIIVPVGKNEFLLTCGTAPDEPAMGIVINSNGDVSRGTFAFESYPVSITVDNEKVIIVSFKSSVKIYDLESQLVLQTVEFEKSSNDKDVLLRGDKLDAEVDVKDDGLVELIKLVPLIQSDDPEVIESVKERLDSEEVFAKKISKTKAKLFLLNGLELNLFKPTSKLSKLNNLKNLKSLLKEFNSIQTSNNTNELNFVELEYLNLLTVITGLELDLANDEELIWETLINGTVDPRVFCYLMGYEIYGVDIWLFNGIFDKVEKFKNKRVKSSKIVSLLDKFLDCWIEKKHFVDSKDLIDSDLKDYNVLKTLQLTKLRILISKNDMDKISEFINTSNVSTYEESSNLLVTNPLSIANIHIKKHEYKQAIDLYKTHHDELKSSTKQKELLMMITDLVYAHHSEFVNDQQYLNDLGLWLISQDSTIGLNFIQNKKIHTRGMEDNYGFELIVDNIEDDAVKFAYVENILISLNAEKVRVNLVKNLKRWELKKLDMRLKKYRK